MRKIAWLLLAVLALVCYPHSAAAQGLVSGNQIQILGNGNLAYVTSGNALQSDIHSVGGTTVALVSGGLPVYIEGSAVSAGGTSAIDEATFTFGTTTYTPAGCAYQTTVTSNPLTSGQAGVEQCDVNRRQIIVGAGTAGTASGGVMSVQGVASMVPFEVSPTTSANSLSNQFFTQLSNGTNGQTFMSTATSGKYGADMNILSILGTAPTTAGFIDVKGADGNVYVRSNAGSTFPVNATLQAGTALVGKTAPLTACGAANFSTAWVALPTSATAATATTTCLEYATFCNTSASTAYTVTVSDDQGSPVTVIPTTSIPPASCYNYNFGGETFTSGVKWNASNASVTGALIGFQ